MSALSEEIKKVIRDVPNFPKEGIVFKDITPILHDPNLCKMIKNAIVSEVKNLGVDVVAGIESRGFLFGLSLAMELDVPFVLIRKKGKLPYETVSYKYDLEYGSAEIEMHIDAISPNQKVLIHDDLLATGGTAAAVSELVKKQGATVAGYSFLIELAFLEGSELLTKYSENISTLVRY
ncbi:adenine phosphoribosyltransferase [Paracrocinitomix mangrovi]|uniref:adenine phosphoribosyltransferase n=1 Tax=Paracrocinitomix mangrovi TaxID=2862509 RepID=UPI001C8EC5EA|nr:adenine phosphoribosyltransferase [Paracrocinitomix mangrovi]UKN01020.1 adenine phosphoribosyltransferase [Paracrocinitomix mangrovi]